MKASGFSETSVSICQPKWHRVPEYLDIERSCFVESVEDKISWDSDKLCVGTQQIQRFFSVMLCFELNNCFQDSKGQHLHTFQILMSIIILIFVFLSQICKSTYEGPPITVIPRDSCAQLPCFSSFPGKWLFVFHMIHRFVDKQYSKT